MDGINEKWVALKSKLTSLTGYLPDWMKGNTTVQTTAALHPLANYAGEHDRGGRIPAGRFGLVGEYGPVNVISRRTTASLAAAALMMGGSRPLLPRRRSIPTACRPAITAPNRLPWHSPAA